MSPDFYQTLNRLQKISLVVGLLALAAGGLGTVLAPRQFFVSYLFSYMFWLGLALGCLGVAMLQYLTGGLWGFATRRFLEAGFMTLPVMAVLFVPLVFGLHELYPWSRPEVVAASAVLQRKALYLNAASFDCRAVLYFGVWLAMACYLRKWSLHQDTTASSAAIQHLRTLSGPGMVIYPFTATFAFVDWVMSIEPEWSSTIFPLIVLIGQVLTAFAFVTALSIWCRQQPGFPRVATPKCFLDLSNLILAFVMFWTYISFAQLLIIYSGNLPREISWYLPRIRDGWKWVVGLLVVFHFLLPFFLLLFRTVKKDFSRLAIIAGMVFCAHVLEVFWIVEPSFYPAGLHLHWLDFALVTGIGGIWSAVFFWNLKRHQLLPMNGPYVEPLLSQPAHAK